MQTQTFSFKTFGPDFKEFWRLLLLDLKNWRPWLKQVLFGVFLGAAVIGPGISGSALAVAFGIYDKLIGIIANPFRQFWDNLRYLVPLGIGGVLGIGILAFLLNFLLTSPTSELMVTYLFIGLMLGSLPALVREANDQGFKKSYLVLAALAFLLFLGLGFGLESAAGGSVNLSMNFGTALLGGAVIGLISLSPGLSVSFVLMFLGLYQPLMAAVTAFNLPIIAAIGLGALLAIVCFAKLVKWLLAKFYGQTYYFFIGLALAAMILVWPSLPGGWLTVGAFALLLVGIIGGYFLNQLGGDHQAQPHKTAKK